MMAGHAGNSAQQKTLSHTSASMVVVTLCMLAAGCAQHMYDWECDDETMRCVDKNSGAKCEYNISKIEANSANTQCDAIASKIPQNVESSVGRSRYYFGSSGGAMIWRLNSIIGSVTLDPILEQLMDEKDFRPEFRWRGGGTSSDPVEGEDDGDGRR